MAERVRPMCCELCWHPLDQRNGRYIHGRDDADHEAVPVEWDWTKVNLRCDFCDEAVNALEMQTLPCKDFTLFQVNRATQEVRPLWGSDGHWLACGECAAYLRASDWEGLLDRAVSFKPTNEQEEARLWLSLVWPKLRENIIGEVRPYELGDEQTPAP